MKDRGDADGFAAAREKKQPSGEVSVTLFKPQACAVIRRVRDPYGALSNMAGGFAIAIGDDVLDSVEHLYQASKLPRRLRAEVLVAEDPRTAKFLALGMQAQWNPEWLYRRREVMLWCLSLKLHQHLDRLVPLLLASGSRAIVEWSTKDDFWGAIPNTDGLLDGTNMLGSQWESLRSLCLIGDWQTIAQQGVPPAYFSGDFGLEG